MEKKLMISNRNSFKAIFVYAFDALKAFLLSALLVCRL